MKNQVIIKKVKKIEGGGHHGGAWKVAYADFVTAMMAFFLLMWLVSVSDEATLQGVAQYFTPTESISDKAGLGFDGGMDSNVEKGLNAPHVSASSLVYGSPSRGQRVDTSRETNSVDDMQKEHFINIINSIEKDNYLKKYADNIYIDVTNEGLRIQIMDSNDRPMFEPDTPYLQPYMQEIIKVIANVIRTQPNYISITGHTASVKENRNKIDYWELSNARANAIRRFMSNGLIKEKQVIRLMGKADKEPFIPADPYDAKNMRIGIILLNNHSLESFQKAMPDSK
jgi:chemotaxis protein MotB